MDEAVRQFVRTRAGGLCEYCQLNQEHYPPSFHIEHIRALSHQGDDSLENLALTCPRCNRYKGPNLSAYDPQTQELVTLFNPRTDSWSEHFALQGEFIEGLTAQGRATIELLKMNEEERLILRRHLLGRH